MRDKCEKAGDEIRMEKKVVKRILDRLYLMLIVPIKEKKFISCEGGEKLHYLFFPQKNSNVLLIGFQAFSDKGARYNYVRSISNFPVNRLYIKDDFAENHRGNYYLGCNGTYSVERSVYELIEKYIQKCNAGKLIFIGSSKGGYAAVNFGIHYKFSKMIIAAPQYYVGTYLNHDKFMVNLEDILGKHITEDMLRQLDGRLREKIRNDTMADTQKIYIHYSDKEHTYEEHIKDLLADLSAQGIRISENVGNYTEHTDLRYYFPDYLRQCLEEVLRE